MEKIVDSKPKSEEIAKLAYLAWKKLANRRVKTWRFG